MLTAGEKLAWRSLAPPRIARTIGLARLANRSLSPAAAAFLAAVIAQGGSCAKLIDLSDNSNCWINS